MRLKGKARLSCLLASHDQHLSTHYCAVHYSIPSPAERPLPFPRGRLGMAEQCIVCLGDLRDQLATLETIAAAAEPDLPAEARAHAHAHAHAHAAAAGDDDGDKQLLAKSLLRNTTLTTKRYRHHLPIIPPS